MTMTVTTILLVWTLFLISEIHADVTVRYDGRSVQEKKPNIVFIVADDLGFNDVGWHNPQMPTPNMNRLRKDKTITLENYYVQFLCTPSRAAFMTGLYPYHLGLQHGVIQATQPGYVPSGVKLLPQYLKELNYTTHAVGKWHLGFCNWDMTPTYRGFDSFYGFYKGVNDYYTHAWVPRFSNISVGLDFRDDKEIVRDQNGTYSAFSFTKRAQKIISQSGDEPFYLYLAYQNIHPPLQVPDDYVDNTIRNNERRSTTAMVKILDEAIGNVTETLKNAGKFDDTVLVFTTDNGGWVDAGGNNWPLRGSKGTIWEGGTRGVGFVRYNGFGRSYTHDKLFHAVDWMPTLLEAAGGAVSSIDGVSQWRHLLGLNNLTPRNEFLYNIDEILDVAALRIGDYKLIVGDPHDKNGWYPPLNLLWSVVGNQDVLMADTFGNFVMDTTKRGARKRNLLFDLKNDPSELVDLSNDRPDIVELMLKRMDWYNSSLVSAHFPPLDERGDPKYWNNTWSPGWC